MMTRNNTMKRLPATAAAAEAEYKYILGE